jgi:hypothetical protein
LTLDEFLALGDDAGTLAGSLLTYQLRLTEVDDELMADGPFHTQACCLFARLNRKAFAEQGGNESLYTEANWRMTLAWLRSNDALCVSILTAALTKEEARSELLSKQLEAALAKQTELMNRAFKITGAV